MAVTSAAAETQGAQASRTQQLCVVGSRAQAQLLWSTVLVAPWHVGSFWIRDGTHVSCMGRQILDH